VTIHFLYQPLLKRVQELKKERATEDLKFRHHNNMAYITKKNIDLIDDELFYLMKQLRKISKLEEDV